MRKALELLCKLRLNLIEQKSKGKVLDLFLSFTSFFDLFTHFYLVRILHERT